MLDSLRVTECSTCSSPSDDEVWHLGVAAARAIKVRALDAPILAAAAHNVLEQARRLRVQGVIPHAAGDLFADAGWVERNMAGLAKMGLIDARAVGLCTNYTLAPQVQPLSN